MLTGAPEVIVSGVRMTEAPEPVAPTSRSTTPTEDDVAKRAKPGVPVATPLAVVIGLSVRNGLAPPLTPAVTTPAVADNESVASKVPPGATEASACGEPLKTNRKPLLPIAFNIARQRKVC